MTICSGNNTAYAIVMTSLLLPDLQWNESMAMAPEDNRLQ